MVTTIDDTHGFLTSFRSLAKTSGTQLDEGTKKSLENLAATLRKTARSTDAVGDVKTAKDAINGIIEDTWNEYTGDINNLLLMDATAEAVSLTSDENAAPTSIQVLIRTQEIKKSDAPAESADQIQAAPSTFWGRGRTRCSEISGTLWPVSSGKQLRGVFHDKKNCPRSDP